jgi:hypothetical protein
MKYLWKVTPRGHPVVAVRGLKQTCYVAYSRREKTFIVSTQYQRHDFKVFEAAWLFARSASDLGAVVG